MFLMIACGGSDSKNDDNKNQDENQNQPSGVCTYSTYECHGEDSYFCGYPDSSDDLMWLVAEKCNDGCNEQTGKCKENQENNNPEGNTDSTSEEDPSGSDSEDNGDGNNYNEQCEAGDRMCRSIDTEHSFICHEYSHTPIVFEKCNESCDRPNAISGTCQQVTESTFKCDCENGYLWDWNSVSCENMCEHIDHATGPLTVTGATTFTCGCENGYAWANTQCIKNKWSFENDEDTPSYTNVPGYNSFYVWKRRSGPKRTGSYSMCSTNYGEDNTYSSLRITIDMPEAGTASFYVKGLAEEGCKNKLSNSTQYDQFFGPGGLNSNNTDNHGWSSWTLQTVSLSKGQNTLDFMYNKDDYAPSTSLFSSCGDKREDRFCIDDLEISW